MSKENQKIIVVERDILLGNDYFQGFRRTEDVDYESRILSNFKIMKRGGAETDPTHKQPIGYAIVANLAAKKVFVYQRSPHDKNYAEKRLQGKWAWGFGGHIEPSDGKNGNIIRASVLREVNDEELRLFGRSYSPEVMGYINDDSNDVGKVHFGILYLINTDAIRAEPLDSETERIELVNLSKLEEMCSSSDFNVENWSRISLEPLRKLL